jgi:hypothetical protein
MAYLSSFAFAACGFGVRNTLVKEMEIIYTFGTYMAKKNKSI